MIIKSISVKGGNACFRKLVHYILDQEKMEKPEFLLTRFVSQDPEQAITQFIQNEKGRMHKRKGSVKLFHEIISFDKRDNDQVRNSTKLRKLIRTYAKKRAPHSPMVSAVHDEEDKQLHIHLLFGIQLNGKALRIDKSQYQTIKEEMELEQNLLFSLKHSRINHNPPKKKCPSMMENTESNNAEKLPKKRTS